MTPQSSTWNHRHQLLWWGLWLLLIGTFWNIINNGSSLGKTLWLDFGVHDALAYAVDQGVAAFCIGLAVWSYGRRIAWPLYWVAGWFFLASLGSTYQGGGFDTDFTPFAHASRYALPLALGLIIAHNRASNTNASPLSAIWLLRIAIATTFVAHGIEALLFNPKFVDLILRVCRNWMFLTLSETQAKQLLVAIGIVDIVAAIALIVTPQARAPIVYMIVWGFVTGLARWMNSPEFGFYQMLMRLPHGIIPLWLWFYAYKSRVATNPLALGLGLKV